MEVDLDRNLDPYRVAIFHCGLELPVLHRLNCLFVEAHAQAAEHADTTWAAVDAHNHSQRAHTLILCFASFLGELRVRFENCSGRGHTAAHMEDASTGAAAFTRTKAGTFARSHTAAA